MEENIEGTCNIHRDLIKAIDQAVWLNFKHRTLGYTPFSVIEGPENDYAVVSYDVADLFDDPHVHGLHGDYVDMNFDWIEWLAKEEEPLKHWEELRGAFSTMDGELLRFILLMKIPLEKFIRFELASRGYDENHRWCGLERSKEIWLKNE